MGYKEVVVVGEVGIWLEVYRWHVIIRHHFLPKLLPFLGTLILTELRFDLANWQ